MKPYLKSLLALIAASAIITPSAMGFGLDPERAVKPGTEAPEITGKDLENKPMKLSEFRGKVVVLSFWNSTSDMCKQVLPHHQSLVTKYGTKPFAVLGVGGDKENKDARRFARKENITWRCWNDQGGPRGGTIFPNYGVMAVPVIYVIDAKGVVRGREAYGKDLEALIDRLLAEQAKQPLGKK